MGFDWGEPPAAPEVTAYNGRPAPPWPPSDKPAVCFVCCVDCSTRSTPCSQHSQDCPRLGWRTAQIVVVNRPARQRWRWTERVRSLLKRKVDPR